MNLKQHFTDKQKHNAINEVVFLIKQGFRTRGSISQVGITGEVTSETAIRWAQEAGQVIEFFEGTLVAADEKALESSFEESKVALKSLAHQIHQSTASEKFIDRPITPATTVKDLLAVINKPAEEPSLVLTPLASLVGYGFEGRCSVGCNLPLSDCLSLHWWVIRRQRLTFRDKIKGEKFYTGTAKFVELMRRKIAARFNCYTKQLHGKYDTALLMVGEPLPAYLKEPPEEAPIEF